MLLVVHRLLSTTAELTRTIRYGQAGEGWHTVRYARPRPMRPWTTYASDLGNGQTSRRKILSPTRKQWGPGVA